MKFESTAALNYYFIIVCFQSRPFQLTEAKHLRNVRKQTLFQSEEVATGSSAASAMLLAAMTSRMDISKYLRFTT